MEKITIKVSKSARNLVLILESFLCLCVLYLAFSALYASMPFDFHDYFTYIAIPLTLFAVYISAVLAADLHKRTNFSAIYIDDAAIVLCNKSIPWSEINKIEYNKLGPMRGVFFKVHIMTEKSRFTTYDILENYSLPEFYKLISDKLMESSGGKNKFVIEDGTACHYAPASRKKQEK